MSLIMSEPDADPRSPGATPPGGPLRITHVVLNLDLGGLERIVLDLVRVAQAGGHTPSVLCLERPGRLADQVEALGVPVRSLGKAHGIRWEIVPQIREALGELAPDVVHTHQIGALLYVGRALKGRRDVAVVHTEHINHAAKQKSLARALRNRMLWRLASASAARFFCVADDIARSVAAFGTVPARKVLTIPNGIDTTAFAQPGDVAALRAGIGLPGDARVVGTVGRLNEVKRQDLLLRAFAGLAPAYPDLRVLLVGEGPELDALRALAAELGVADRVHFAGYQARPQQFLHLMEIFALPSRHEGMPLAILEAWASGRPVVASKVGGVPKLIADGANGLLFESGDEAGLVAALRSLLDDPARAARLAAAGQRLARDQFDLKVMASAYERHYREVLAGLRGSPPARV